MTVIKVEEVMGKETHTVRDWYRKILPRRCEIDF